MALWQWSQIVHVSLYLIFTISNHNSLQVRTASALKETNQLNKENLIS